MAADLFETYVVTTVATMVLASIYFVGDMKAALILLPLGIAALCDPRAAPAAAPGDELPVPLVMKGLPPGSGSWQVEMLEGPHLEQMRQQTGGKVTICRTAAQALAAHHASQTGESHCSAKLVENAADHAVVETHCKGTPANESRSTITADGPQSFMITHDQTVPTATHLRMRLSYLGACSASDAPVTLSKDSPACQQARARSASMDPATACAASGAQQAQCEAMMKRVLEQVMAACR